MADIPSKTTTYRPLTVGLMPFEDGSGSLLGTLPSGEQVRLDLPPLGVAILKRAFAEVEVAQELEAKLTELIAQAKVEAAGLVLPDGSIVTPS